MAMLAWIMMGLAIWHFTIFLPDRFWGGIVGAFVGAVIGAMLTGFIFFELSGNTLSEADLATLFAAVPGTLIGLAVVYVIGARTEVRT